MKFFACTIALLFSSAFAAPAVFEEKNETPAPSHECSGKKDGDLVGDRQDPTIFYECLSNGWAYRFHCPSGLIFSESIQRCTYDPKHPVTHAPEEQLSKFDCRHRNDGFYADRHNPRSFHRCYNGLAADFTCPAGTVFEQSKEVCVYNAQWDKLTTEATTEEVTRHHRTTEEPSTTEVVTRHHRTTEEPSTTEVVTRHHRTTEEPSTTEEVTRHHRTTEHVTRHHRTTTEETFPTEIWTTVTTQQPTTIRTTEFVNPFDPEPRTTRGRHGHHDGH